MLFHTHLLWYKEFKFKVNLSISQPSFQIKLLKRTSRLRLSNKSLSRMNSQLTRKKSKNTPSFWSVCLIFFCIMGVISLAKCIFFAFKKAGTETIEFSNWDNTTTIVPVNTGPFYFLFALKLFTSFLLIKLGRKGLKLFKGLK